MEGSGPRPLFPHDAQPTHLLTFLSLPDSKETLLILNSDSSLAQTAGQAILHSDGVKRVSGTLSLHGTSLTFQSGDGITVTLPLEQLSMTRGGANNRYLYFKHSSAPKVSLYTDDFKFLNHFLDIRVPHVSRNAKALLKSEKKSKVILISALAAIPTLIVMLYVFRAPVANLVVSAIPTTADVRLGEAVDKSLKTRFKFVSDKNIDRTVHKLAQPLLEAASSEFEHPFTIKVVENSEINAFATPGGFIYIQTGLLQKAKTPLQVQGVLAHEIAHVVKRHTVRSLAQNIGVYTAFSILLGDISGVVAMGASLLQLQFSREHEVEADTYGRQLMLEANINPSGMTQFFQILLQREQELQSKEAEDLQNILSILSTHPQTQERVKKLKVLDKNLEKHHFKQTLSQTEWQDFQTLVKEKF